MSRAKSWSEIEDEKLVAEQKAEGERIDSLWESHESLLAEMRRYLPLLERAEADSAVWDRLTAGTGIATLNGYRHVLEQAEGQQ